MDDGLWIMDYGLWMLDCGCWIVDVGLWMMDCQDEGVVNVVDFTFQTKNLRLKTRSVSGLRSTISGLIYGPATTKAELRVGKNMGK